MEEQNNFLIIRKPTKEDKLEKISELLYKTDPFIYPYWFETLENCINELTPLLVEDKFFFNISNLYVAVNREDNEIVGVTCITDKSVNLDYDYEKLKEKNERYKFTIENYIEALIKEVKESTFAYISNVCVDENYRGRHIGNYMINKIIEIYKEKLFNEIVLDVLADNPGAIKLYQNLGFEQFTEIFEGFNDPNKKKPEVFSMKANINEVKE